VTRKADGGQAIHLETKHPEKKHPGTKRHIQRDKTSGRQNVRGNKTSGEIMYVEQNSHGDKTSDGTELPFWII
jgi:hypothetical protein